MIASVKKCCHYLRNVLAWLAPFILFCIALFIAAYLLKGDLAKYIELLKILIWPVTVLISLFFFRKVVTYMFFSMDEFNFFGIKGDLKNVHEMINEEVEKKFTQQNEEEKRKDEMNKLEDKLSNTSANAEENHKLAQEIYKSYKNYKQEAQKKIQELSFLSRDSKEDKSLIFNSGNTTPAPAEQSETELGTGEGIGNWTGTVPQV